MRVERRNYARVKAKIIVKHIAVLLRISHSELRNINKGE